MQKKDQRSSSLRRTKKKKKTSVSGIWIGFLALILILVGTYLTGLAVSGGNRIFPNVTIGGIAVGGMNAEEAEQELVRQGWEEKTSRTLHVETIHGITMDLPFTDSGVLPDTGTAVRAAIRYGRTGNAFVDLFRFLICHWKETDICSRYPKLNSEFLNEKIAECANAVNELLGDDGYIIDVESCELRLVKGQGTVRLDSDGLCEAVTAALLANQTELTFTGLTGESACPDFGAIYEAVYSEMQNARFSNDGTYTIIPESVGYQFDITEAQSLWEQAELADTVCIPIEVTVPEVTAEYLESRLYRDLLGATTTKYNNSGENRCSNVRLAASLINEVVLYPGEEFSYNEVVGVRTEERGFLPAPAYAGYDDIKEEIGGGICQVSTTLYASALFAFLDVTSHTSHIYPPNYIQLGLDATVTIPEGGGRTIDFKFKNNKSYPIKIIAYCEETEKDGKPFKTVTVEIWGTLEDDDFMPIEFDNSYSTIYDYDRVIEPAYEDREGYKIKFTHEEQEFEDDTGKGIRTLTHRLVYDSAGNLVQDHIVNPTYSAGYALDTYYYHNYD